MYSFADNESEDRDIAIFTKRLDTLLASATTFEQEANRLPAAIKLLSEDWHLSADFQVKLVKVLTLMNNSAIAQIQPEIDRAKRELAQLDERGKWADPADRRGQRQLADDRAAYTAFIDDLEKKRKQKVKFPTRSTLAAFTDAVEEAKLVPEFYVLTLQNGFGTNATLRKILQSLLALRGFEQQL